MSPKIDVMERESEKILTFEVHLNKTKINKQSEVKTR
jgi:hypothetical protein